MKGKDANNLQEANRLVDNISKDLRTIHFSNLTRDLRLRKHLLERMKIDWLELGAQLAALDFEGGEGQ